VLKVKQSQAKDSFAAKISF